MNIEDITPEKWIGISIAIGFVILVILVFLRAISGGKAEVTLADAVIALIPLVVALFATDRIEKLGIGPGGITIEGAFVGALEADIVDQVVEIDPVLAEAKGGVGRIPEYLRQGVQALTFRIGGSYVPDIMERYFRELTQSPRFQYLIVLEPDGRRFFGMMEARQLLALVDRGVVTWAQLRRFIEEEPFELSDLPGFIRADSAVGETVTKREALTGLERTDLDWLPVVNQEGRFVGVVDRSNVTASLILDVAATLSKRDAGP